jgi:hypothetical protein
LSGVTIFQRKFEASLFGVTGIQAKLLRENLPPTGHQDIFWETVMFMAYITCFDGCETCIAVRVTKFEGQFSKISWTDLGQSFLGPHTAEPSTHGYVWIVNSQHALGRVAGIQVSPVHQRRL